MNRAGQGNVNYEIEGISLTIKEEHDRLIFGRCIGNLDIQVQTVLTLACWGRRRVEDLDQCIVVDGWICGFPLLVTSVDMAKKKEHHENSNSNRTYSYCSIINRLEYPISKGTTRCLQLLKTRWGLLGRRQWLLPVGWMLGRSKPDRLVGERYAKKLINGDMRTRRSHGRANNDTSVQSGRRGGCMMGSRDREYQSNHSKKAKTTGKLVDIDAQEYLNG